MKTLVKMTALLLVLGLLLPGLAVAQDDNRGVLRIPLMSDYDLDSATYTYCRTLGQGSRAIADGYPGAGRIKTSGSSTTVVSYTSASGALNLLSAGDELEINDQGQILTRYVVAAASDDSITVNSAVDLSSSSYRWRDLECGTAADSGWFSVQGFRSALIQFQIDQLNVTGGIDVKVDCRVQGSASTSGVTVFGYTGALINFTATGSAGYLISSSWDECRLGFKIGTSDDGGDLTTNMEKLSAYVALRR